MVVKQFLSAHAALEQSWCNHWGAAGRLDRWSSDQDAAMAALESALVVHSAAASGLQEGMHIFDPAVVVSLQTSRQQAQSFKTDSAASTAEATSRHASIKKRCSRLFISRAEKLVTLASRVTAAAESGFEFISWSATRVEVPMEVLAALHVQRSSSRACTDGRPARTIDGIAEEIPGCQGTSRLCELWGRIHRWPLLDWRTIQSRISKIMESSILVTQEDIQVISWRLVYESSWRLVYETTQDATQDAAEEAAQDAAHWQDATA